LCWFLSRVETRLNAALKAGKCKGPTPLILKFEIQIPPLAFCCGFEVGAFLDRLEGDWDRGSTKKAWMYRDAWCIHAACGGFGQIIQQLQESVPQRDFQEAMPGLTEQFKLGILDGDIVNVMETTVPPLSLDQVPFVRTAIFGSNSKGWCFLFVLSVLSNKVIQTKKSDPIFWTLQSNLNQTGT